MRGDVGVELSGVMPHGKNPRPGGMGAYRRTAFVVDQIEAPAVDFQIFAQTSRPADWCLPASERYSFSPRDRSAASRCNRASPTRRRASRSSASRSPSVRVNRTACALSWKFRDALRQVGDNMQVRSSFLRSPDAVRTASSDMAATAQAAAAWKHVRKSAAFPPGFLFEIRFGRGRFRVSRKRWPDSLF